MFFRYNIFIFYFLRIKVVYFSKNFCCQIHFLDLFYQIMFCAPFYITYYNNFLFLTTIIFCFLYFFKELGALFLRCNFSKYDLLIIAFLSTFVTCGGWLARSYFFFRGPCSSKINKNIFSKEA